MGKSQSHHYTKSNQSRLSVLAIKNTLFPVFILLLLLLGSINFYFALITLPFFIFFLFKLSKPVVPQPDDNIKIMTVNKNSNISVEKGIVKLLDSAHEKVLISSGTLRSSLWNSESVIQGLNKSLNKNVSFELIVSDNTSIDKNSDLYSWLKKIYK